MDIKKTFKDFVNEANLNEGKFDGIADLVKALHFETDSKTAEEMKMAIGKSQGEFNKKKQIEGGEYSLRRFRKEIKFGDGTYLGVFLPGSYDAATSVLGDGPHKKAVKKVKWNQKKYDQWLEDSASNGGADNAFDMAQNAKNEIGLIDWVKKEFRGDDPLQRIQWDIEGYAESIEVYESVTTEGKYYGMIAGDAASDIAKELSFYVKKIIKQSNGKVTYFHVKDQPSVNKTMYSLRDLYGIESQSGDRKFSPYKTVKFDNDQIISETVTENRELIKIDSYLNTKDERVLIDFCDDVYGNSDDRKTKKEWNDARNDLSYNELVDYAVAHAENFGMDLQDIEDAIEVYESLVTEAKDMTFADYLEVLDVKFEDAMAAVKGENGSDAEIKPTRGDILQNFTLFRNYVSSLTKKYKGDKTRLRFLTECVNEYNGIINESTVNEGKIKYSKGKTYQSDGHWTVYVDSNSSGFDIRVNHSAGWRLDPQDVREETIQLLDNGRQKATLNFKSGNIDKFAQQMFDLNDRTTNGNQTKLTAKDYADIIRVWIDMKMANESVVNEAKFNRAEITDFIEKHVKFVRTTEEFDGSEGGIWVSGESNDKYKGKIIYDYYSEDHKTREFGVLNNWEKELNKLGWYSEWYDAGTVMIWEI